MKGSTSRRVYMDHASTTPIDSRVLKAMKPFFSDYFYNPSALYAEGVSVSDTLLKARKEVAQVLSAHQEEIVFTGSGTEADNLAILGAVRAAKKHIAKPHVIMSAIEHPALIELEGEIKSLGGTVTFLAVSEDGLVNPKDLRKVLTKNTVVVSVIYANNEIGTIQPIKDLAKEVRHFRKHKKTFSHYPYVHTDASQAANYCDLRVATLGVDLMTLDGSKIYGPKGVGALFVRRGVSISPVVWGGGQEMGLRSGTENIPLIVGFSKALSLVAEDRDRESKRLTKLRDTLISGIISRVRGSSLNGSREYRLPNNVNICVPGLDGEHAVIIADSLGILCSTASSCRTLSENARSYVIEAIGKDSCAESSLRLSLGRGTTPSEVAYVLKNISSIVSKASTISF